MTAEVNAHIEARGLREGEVVVHMAAEAMVAVAWGQTRGSETVVAGAVAAAPDHPEGAIRTRMALVSQHTVEVNVAPKAKELLDATQLHRNLPAATVLLRLLQFEHKVLEWSSACDSCVS